MNRRTMADCAMLAATILTSCLAAAPPRARPAILSAAHASGSAAPFLMRAHFVDVAQGAATLVEFPCAAILIDTGGEKDDSYDSTAALTEYLDAFFLSRPELDSTLATLVITHPHIDHDRGAAAVVERYHVEHVVTDGLETSSGGSQQAALHAWADAHHVPLDRVAVSGIPPTGLHDPTIDAVACPTIDPDIRALWGAAPGVDAGNANNDSVAVRIVVGSRSMLITGDLQEEGIAAMLARYANTAELLDVDLYVVGHHGSHNGTTPALVAAMSPEVSVIQMGPESVHEQWCAYEYGHPSCAVVDVLASATTRTRPPIDTRCGTHHEEFEDRHVAKAVYGVGWDGTIVATFAADGTIDMARVNDGHDPRHRPSWLVSRRFARASQRP